MNTLKKIFIVLFMITILLFGSVTTFAASLESGCNQVSAARMIVTNRNTGEKVEIPITKVEESVQEYRSLNGSKIIEKGYEATVLFDENDNLLRATTDNSSTNTSEAYGWKGKVYIKYEDTGSTARFYYTSGSWSKVGTTSTTLSNRRCTFGYVLTSWSKAIDKKLTGNFTYYTGFNAYKYGTGSFIGCNSHVDISNGYTLETICNVNF